jgi:hypothetical protein
VGGIGAEICEDNVGIARLGHRDRTSGKGQERQKFRGIGHGRGGSLRRLRVRSYLIHELPASFTWFRFFNGDFSILWNEVKRKKQNSRHVGAISFL